VLNEFGGNATSLNPDPAADCSVTPLSVVWHTCAASSASPRSGWLLWWSWTLQWPDSRCTRRGPRGPCRVRKARGESGTCGDARKKRARTAGETFEPPGKSVVPTVQIHLKQPALACDQCNWLCKQEPVSVVTSWWDVPGSGYRGASLCQGARITTVASICHEIAGLVLVESLPGLASPCQELVE
jgi:hypothetical protein